MSAPYDPLEPAYKRTNQNVIYDKNISIIDKELKEYMEKEIILETNVVITFFMLFITSMFTLLII